MNVVEPRKVVTIGIGRVIYGGRAYLHEGKPAHAIALVGDDFSAACKAIHAVEHEHGMPWFPVTPNENPPAK